MDADIPPSSNDAAEVVPTTDTVGDDGGSSAIDISTTTGSSSSTLTFDDVEQKVKTTLSDLLRKFMNSSTPHYVDDANNTNMTDFELYTNIALGVAFLVTALVAAKRMYGNSRQIALNNAASANNNAANGRQPQSTSTSSGGGAETTVVTAFYSLILATSLLRAIWFLLPSLLWQPQYTPAAVYAFETDDVTIWIGYAASELIVTAGSLTLFSIFILILVYWADILKKYYNPGSRRSLPMTTFLGLVVTLLLLEATNLGLFLDGLYSTEGMILFNAVLLAVVSIVCVCEITIFSRKFQNVLKTLGAINQVSTDSQIRRIVWITVTGNLFFFSRALLESIFAAMLIVYYIQNKTVDRAFSHVWWDVYTQLKYWSELTILALMLHILQSRFSGSSRSTTSSATTPGTATGEQPSQSNTAGYQKVPDAQVSV